MKYVGIYWTLFAPMMKKSIARRFDKELAGQSGAERLNTGTFSLIQMTWNLATPWQ